MSCYFGHVGKGLGKKAIVNCKVLTSQTGQQTVTIYIARYRKKKDNETMKLSQLIEYYMEIFFFKIQAQIVEEKLFPDPVLKNQN